MFNKLALMGLGLGALIALSPVTAMAQTDTTAPAMAKPAHATHTGSHRGHVRRKGHTAQHRARSSAEHVRHKMTTPAAPKS
jgi:hypothetical protein